MQNPIEQKGKDMPTVDGVRKLEMYCPFAVLNRSLNSPENDGKVCVGPTPYQLARGMAMPQGELPWALPPYVVVAI